MEGLGAVASAIAVVELTAKVGSLCLEYSSAVKSARSDIKRLRKHTDTLKTTAEGVRELLQGPYGARLETSQKLREALSNTCSQLGDVATKLEEKLHKGHRAKTMRRVGLRAFGWPFESKDVDKIIANLQRDQDSFSAALQIDQITEILDIHSKIDLAALPVASGAASDSHAEEHNARCHPDTRTKLLRQIREWASDPQAENIFWLNGMAGTGKSTISRTVATSFAKDGLLGASFFFKRGEGNRGNAGLVFPTIARQLVHKIPALVPSIREAIDADPDIPKRALRDQFEKLILHPLGCIQRTTAIVVIIDALDECDGDKDVKTIISLFAQASVIRSVRLRIFITSRPELPIRLGFKDVQGKYQGLALHQIPEQVVEQDISTFLAYELTRIKDEYNGQVPLGWPGENDIRTLAQMAVPLFIFAATVCRFVDDQGRSNPAKRLKERQLLDVECENVHALLNSLHSVLDIPSVDDAPVRLFHLSFRDFLVDPAKRTKNEFWIDEAEYHKTLTERCIQLMDQCLGQDICCLKVPGMLRSELDQQTINAHLPPEVQYACQYWVHHLKESKHNIEDDGPAHAFLTNHLLHWLEVLSLLGRLSDGVLLIRTLLHAAQLQPDTAPNFVDFLSDAEKFIRSHGAIRAGADGQKLSVPTPFTIKGQDVQPKDHVKILGVVMDAKLRYKEHIARAASKGLSAAMELKRLSGLSPATARQLFTAMVAPVVDYASSVWMHQCNWEDRAGHTQGAEGRGARDHRNGSEESSASPLPDARGLKEQSLQCDSGLPGRSKARSQAELAAVGYALRWIRNIRYRKIILATSNKGSRDGLGATTPAIRATISLSGVRCDKCLTQGGKYDLARLDPSGYQKRAPEHSQSEIKGSNAAGRYATNPGSCHAVNSPPYRMGKAGTAHVLT
ncbi:hypothetical protein CHGG_01924 [Chaetomium globosum CBS 148.51]|uniref:NACHT domain-containing protein n=1 Tax=Chaetomium globosum (strain ATCC 6205 / CBS 148.51 / DSM 1962 / NBRC 6347 / NRRL 1970) TaxID=306901 RepID=Q2HCY0_CHAGB|nr:uncharacterized protein CHGG_01924 [Chaetomium globosum CBS 148.51]EAQ93689.1 hypothetical protein CHGG_01924 [Chaetomium globosum CBS 148.51]